MNAITCTGQKIQDIYNALPLSATSAIRCSVIYSLNMQAKVNSVCFHSIADGSVMSCFEVSDSLTEAQWLALINQQIEQYMVPVKADAIDTMLGVITCTAAQYTSIVSYIDDMEHVYKLKQTDKIDRVAAISKIDGTVTLKGIISDAPTEAYWLANVTSVAVSVDNLTFDMP